MFAVRFLSIKELTLLFFECSIFEFSDKRVTFISFGCLFVFSYKELSFISFRYSLFVFSYK